MGDAGKIVAECHAMLADKIKPGITTLELDQITEKLIRHKGAIPSFKGHHGFPATHRGHRSRNTKPCGES